MNWYKIIKFADKMIPIGDICQHIYQSIQLQNNGNWTVESNNLVPGYRNQKYIVCKLTGTDVVLPGDWFHIKVFTYIRKAPKVVHPYEGSYGMTRGWDEPYMAPALTEEEVQARWEYMNRLKPMEVKEYHSEKGSELIKFTVVIWGAKSEPENKGYFHIDEIGESELKLKTPYEIGQFVKTTINKFYFGGEDDNNDEPEDIPMPPTSGMGVENPEYAYV